MDNESLIEKIVAALPGVDGWWHDEGAEPFIECGYALEEAGMSVEEIRDLLRRMYNAVRAEYGD